MKLIGLLRPPLLGREMRQWLSAAEAVGGVGLGSLRHSWALVKAGTALDQARGGLETPFSSVIFSYLILARPALRRSRPSVACLTTSGLAHTADAQALRRWPPPSGLAHTAGAHPYIFSYFYSTRGRALARRPSGLASRPTLVHSKAATPVSLADGATRCCACAGQRYTYDERA